MNRLIPLNKQSKRAQRAFHAKQRGSWNGLCPITKCVESRKNYSRPQSKCDLRRQPERDV